MTIEIMHRRRPRGEPRPLLFLSFLLFCFSFLFFFLVLVLFLKSWSRRQRIFFFFFLKDSSCALLYSHFICKSVKPDFLAKALTTYRLFFLLLRTFFNNHFLSPRSLSLSLSLSLSISLTLSLSEYITLDPI
jgi:hypothetical protein